MNKEKLQEILRRLKSSETWNDEEIPYKMEEQDIIDILEALLES